MKTQLYINGPESSADISHKIGSSVKKAINLKLSIFHRKSAEKMNPLYLENIFWILPACKVSFYYPFYYDIHYLDTS
jgi:hypothetical protein